MSDIQKTGEGHTPGPWHYEASSAFPGEFIIQGSYENGGGPRLPVLGRTHNFPRNAEANARLIATAPDMYDVLQLIVGSLRFDREEELNAEVLRRVKAAIAKAQGL